MDQNELKLTLLIVNREYQIETLISYFIFYSPNSWSLFAARACRPSQRYDCQSITGRIPAWFWHISFGWSRQEQINYWTGTHNSTPCIQIGQLGSRQSCCVAFVTQISALLFEFFIDLIDFLQKNEYINSQ